jgi:chromosome segregation ATPase
MSARAPAEPAAFVELETLVRHLGDELAGFRRRALVAEARVKELESAASGTAAPASEELQALEQRIHELESENGALRERLGTAAERTRQMLDRVHFLRQQAQGGGDR